MTHQPILVIGGGAAGLLAAIAAARQGQPVILLEKGQKPGRKILVSGAGRCNISNASPMYTFIDQYFGQGRFLYTAYKTFFRESLLALLSEAGVKTICEPNGKIFPASGKALDIVNALIYLAGQAGVTIHVNEPVLSVTKAEQPAVSGQILEVRTSHGLYQASAVIIATGGLSWPQTGAEGDGYRLAAALGHTVSRLRPALTGFVLNDPLHHELQGISHDRVTASLFTDGKKLASASGEMIWTHFGASGPALLRLSRELPDDAGNKLVLEVDLLPQMDRAALSDLLLKTAHSQPRKTLQNALQNLPALPGRMSTPLLTLAALPAMQQAGHFSRFQSNKLTGLLKHLQLPVMSVRGYEEAMVTAGGVSLKEIDPKTMASKLVSGLFFAGEVMDLDGDTGGYNLQAAFSTGWVAGTSAALWQHEGPK